MIKKLLMHGTKNICLSYISYFTFCMLQVKYNAAITQGLPNLIIIDIFHPKHMTHGILFERPFKNPSILVLPYHLFLFHYKNLLNEGPESRTNYFAFVA